MTGNNTRRPCSPAKRSSSGWTATAVSPSIVSGRVVATTTSPLPSTRGYRTCHSFPSRSWYSTSRSESAVWQRGHQLMI